MSSPRLGVVRDSMLINPRIVKAPLGQSMSINLSLPGPNFTYGIKSLHRDVGVAEVLSGWRIQPSRGHSAPHQTKIPDFVSLNRDAVRSGLVTSKELSQYRAQRGVVNNALKPKGSLTSQRPVVPDITFGIRNRTPSPLPDILSHQHGQRWLDKQLTRNQISNNQQKLQRIKSSTVQNNRTSLLRRSRPLPVTQTPFKLTRFTQVAPALDTFRDQEARRQAFRARQLNSASSRRVQDLGTGVLDLPEEDRGPKHSQNKSK